MYYLSKFCRICVQTGVKLLDLDTLDFDEVKLSEKLEVCTKMVVSRESLSTEICVQCITKLRISYQFHDMCKKSTNTLQGYLEALLLSTNDEKVNIKEFVNTDLNVIVTPIPSNVSNIDSPTVNDNDDNMHICYRERKKRITKEQRCSLLKRLLMPTDEYKEDKIKFPYKRNSYFTNSKGGLKNIIHFTKNYEFGCKLDKNSNYESTPLDKLTAFSNEFFRKDFSEFRNTILYIIENKDNFYDSGDSDDEDLLFLKCDETEEDSKQSIVKFEEVIVEPDIKIKTEFEYEDEEFMYNCEEPHIEIICKTENDESHMESESSTTHNCSSIPTSVPMNYSGYMNSFLHTVTSNSSTRLVDSLVGSYHHGQRRTFSQSNVRCRTRDNPYINPLLKDQFLYRCFKCDKCNRYFKSPGYLKAHHSKVH